MNTKEIQRGRQDLQDFEDIFYFFKISGRNFETQSAFSRKGPVYTFFLVFTGKLFISPEAIGFEYFLPENAQINPVNLVDPVYKFFS